jgi:Domain of unknown function (DUF3854)
VQERANPDTLNDVYRALLALLPLAPRPRQNLRWRGLSDGEIIQRHYRTMRVQGRADLARRLVDRFGPEVCARVPGLYIRKEGRRSWWSLAGASGLVIPVRDVKTRVIALIIRRDDPDADPRYSAVSSKTYSGPGSGAPLHVPLFQGIMPERVRLTEGILKADIATALSGTLTLGLRGVSTWRHAIPVLREIPVRTLVLAFDADACRKWTVARALQRSAAALKAAGVEVVLERWREEEGKGIDDVLSAGKHPEVVIGRAVPEAIRAIVHAAHRADPLLRRQHRITLQQRYLQQQHLPTVDPWLGPEAALQGVPLMVRHLGQDERHE